MGSGPDGVDAPALARFVTCNLLHGRALGEGEVQMERMLSALQALAPDVLAIQEVDRMQPRSGGVDQTAAIAASLGHPGWRFVPTLLGEPGGDWAPADVARDTGAPGAPGTTRAYGVGLIVRWPVRSWHAVVLRAFPRRSPVFVPGANRVMLIADEPRVCVAAVVEAPWGTCTIACTHLSFVPGWNVAQLRRVATALRGLPGPRLLLGDLNLPAPVPAAASRWTSLAVHPTFPGPAPRFQIDHALLHDPEQTFPSVARTAALELPFSDHRALQVDVSPGGPR